MDVGGDGAGADSQRLGDFELAEPTEIPQCDRIALSWRKHPQGIGEHQPYGDRVLLVDSNNRFAVIAAQVRQIGRLLSAVAPAYGVDREVRGDPQDLPGPVTLGGVDALPVRERSRHRLGSHVLGRGLVAQDLAPKPRSSSEQVGEGRRETTDVPGLVRSFVVRHRQVNAGADRFDDTSAQIICGDGQRSSVADNRRSATLLPTSTA